VEGAHETMGITLDYLGIPYFSLFKTIEKR
jgi:hypothetical protein